MGGLRRFFVSIAARRTTTACRLRAILVIARQAAPCKRTSPLSIAGMRQRRILTRVFTSEIVVDAVHQQCISLSRDHALSGSNDSLAVGSVLLCNIMHLICEMLLL